MKEDKEDSLGELWCHYSGMPSPLAYIQEEKNMNRLIKSQEELNRYMEEVRLRGKSFEPNPTTVSFCDGFDNLEPYNFNKEYIKVVKENNHETIHRIKYENEQTR